MIETDLHCESDLHHGEKTLFVLVQVYVRKGAANRWLPQWWCQTCLAEEYLRRHPNGPG